MAKITTLIDKQDYNEIVRDKIASILAVEIANQRQLAVNEGKPNPDDYYFNTFVERAKPWEVLTNNTDGSEIGEMPLVNVLFDNDVFDNRGSSQVNRQKAVGNFYIDCYAHKNRTSSDAGDELTSKESDKIARLVRNILMAEEYTYLNLPRDTVVKRYVMRREKYIPDIQQEGFENVVCTRVTLEVTYYETVEETPAEILENVYGEIKINESGQVVALEFDYT